MPKLDEWKHLLIAGGLAGGVVGTLVLGAALRVDGSAPEPPPLGAVDVAPTPPPLASRTPVLDDPSSAPPAQAGDTAPAPTRTPRTPSPSIEAPSAVDSATRLSASGARWTLQYMVTCREEVTRELSRTLGDEPGLFVLPVRLDDGRTCQRICWGRYASRDAALAARDVPRAVAALAPKPIPKSVGDVLP